MKVADVATARAGVLLLWTVRDYQRAACRATNIAERVIYTATGETPELSGGRPRANLARNPRVP